MAHGLWHTLHTKIHVIDEIVELLWYSIPDINTGRIPTSLSPDFSGQIIDHIGPKCGSDQSGYKNWWCVITDIRGQGTTCKGKSIRRQESLHWSEFVLSDRGEFNIRKVTERINVFNGKKKEGPNFRDPVDTDTEREKSTPQRDQ